MAQKIESHALEHKEKGTLTEEETDRIRDFLIAQTFKLAAKTKKL
jgi:hypothetical protein